jgi:hypothetical protein
MSGFLRKRGDPRPIGFTAQEIAITFLSISFLFIVVTIYFPNRKIFEISTQTEWYIYDIMTLGFMFFLVFIFALIGIVFLAYGDSKYDLNMWKDRVHPDWQPTVRIDKNGTVTNQIMKKDSLGFVKGIAFGKKAGIINRGSGFRLSLPNGNSLLMVMDFMSHNANPLEAVGWQLYKKKFGVVGYNAYTKCKREKKTLLSIDEKGRQVIKEEVKNSRIGEQITPNVSTIPQFATGTGEKKKKRRFRLRRKKKDDK